MALSRAVKVIIVMKILIVFQINLSLSFIFIDIKMNCKNKKNIKMTERRIERMFQVAMEEIEERNSSIKGETSYSPAWGCDSR